MRCPHCGNSDPSLFSKPVQVASSAGLGINVPFIRQCLVCKTTEHTAAFQEDSSDYIFAASLRTQAYVQVDQDAAQADRLARIRAFNQRVYGP